MKSFTTTKFVVAILVVLVTAQASSLPQEHDRNKEVSDLAPDGRGLQNTLVCTGTEYVTSIEYDLVISLSVSGDGEFSNCGVEEMTSIGQFVNQMVNQIDVFADLGVISVGAELCLDPTSIENGATDRRQLTALRLPNFFHHFYFRGGGRCWFCAPDNRDRRNLKSAVQQIRKKITEQRRKRHLATQGDASNGLRGQAASVKEAPDNQRRLGKSKKSKSSKNKEKDSTPQPTPSPTPSPTRQPTRRPTRQPTSRPSPHPTRKCFISSRNKS